MNEVSITYVLLVTVLGMSVVFVFLTSLSFLMVILKKVFPAAATTTAGAGKGESSREVTPEWVAAAVAAFLTVEAREAEPQTATSWLPAAGEGEDAWLAGGRVECGWPPEGPWTEAEKR